MEVFARARGATADQLTAFELIPRIGLEFAMRHTPDLADPIAEKHPYYALVEVSSSQADSGLRDTLETMLGELMEAGLVTDGVIASSKAQALELWKIREGTAVNQLYEGGSIKHDVSVPVTSIPEFLRRAKKVVDGVCPGALPVPFGHFGDGNLHYNVTQPPGMDRDQYLALWVPMSEAIFTLVTELGGSISAEHGIGQMKRDALKRYKSDVELDMMRAIKRALDPKGILNPGKVL
jgi:FAD/FMN-containing dehydrogenase